VEELNKLEPTKIYKESGSKYYINYNKKLGDYIKGGIIEEVKIPQKINYISYKDYINNPKSVFELDYSKKERNCLIHCFVSSIQKFFDIHQKLPDINNDKQAEEIVNFSKEFYLKFKNHENILFRYSKIFDDTFIKNLALYSGIQLPTDSSFLGGVLAQEILKFSVLYRPLNQILYYNNYITIENLKNDKNKIKILQKDRYYENIIYGENIIQKLKKLNIFVIGAGTLGCEIMKILALMGTSTEKNANIILTDNDSIESSNLNRQFFLKKNILEKIRL
jgi:ubiquitin-activating enzyme E1